MKSKLVKWKERLVLVRESIIDLKRCERYAIRRVEQEERRVGICRLSKFVLILLLVYLLGFTTGCATMSGLGEDITAVSNGLAKSAVEHNK